MKHIVDKRGIVLDTIRSEVRTNRPIILYGGGYLTASNILFITGVSGSGKSTLARKFEKGMFKRFEIDWLENITRLNEMCNGFDAIHEFLDKQKIDYKTIDDIPVDELYDLQFKLINEIIDGKLSGYPRGQEIIIEGMQLMQRFQLFNQYHRYYRILNGRIQGSIYDLFPIIFLDIDRDVAMIKAYNRSTAKDKPSMEEFIDARKGMYQAFDSGYSKFKKYVSDHHISIVQFEK